MSWEVEGCAEVCRVMERSEGVLRGVQGYDEVHMGVEKCTGV